MLLPLACINTSSAHGPADYQAKAKLDRENEVKPPATVDKSVGQAISKARQDKKDANGKSMSQKDLATKINEKPALLLLGSAQRGSDRLGVTTKFDAEHTLHLGEQRRIRHSPSALVLGTQEEVERAKRAKLGFLNL
jgi:ribosome-binding protein aMBF1 (putative translation factor)